MKQQVSLFVTLLFVWIIFSGWFGLFFIVSGIFSALIVLALTKRMQLLPKRFPPLYIHPRMLRYYIWLLKEIVLSAKDVSVRVWKGGATISPVLGWVKNTQHSDAGKTVFANSITLTPGTVTASVEGKYVRVHALSRDGFESLATGAMDKNVTRAVEG